MVRLSEEDKGRAFDVLHDPDRPIYHVGHARRLNSAEDYNSKEVRAIGKRLLKGSLKLAHDVLEVFARNAKKPK